MYIHIKEIKTKYQPRIEGILHLGAHLGEEARDYYEAGISNVIWIEGNPALIEGLKQNVEHYKGNKVYNLLVSDEENKELFLNVTSFSQSSSVLELGITKEVHQTEVVNRIPLLAHRVDTFFQINNLDILSYNFVNIDLQGYELVALKSMGTLLDKVDWVYSEVNVKSLYQDCALLYQMDTFLLKKGFVRVETYMTTHFWGDALYKRVEMNIAESIYRLCKIYTDEAVRMVSDYIQTFLMTSKSFAKRVVKRILSTI